MAYLVLMTRSHSALTLTAVLLALSACGGGGSTASTSAGAVAPGAPAPPKTVLAAATLSIVVTAPPATGSLKRRPAFVSAGAQSISVALYPVAANGTIAATPSSTTNVDLVPSPSCSGAPLTCNIVLNAPVGTVTFGATLYPQLAEAGTALATFVPSVQHEFTVVQNATNIIGFSLNGVVGSLAVSLLPNAVTVGQPATVTLSVIAKDAAGFVILGPGTYDQPIVITTTPALPAPLSFGGATTITTPAAAAVVPVAYTGALAAGPITFTATSGAIAGSAVLAIAAPGGVTLTPNPVQFTSVPSSSSVAVTEANYAGTFSFVDSPPGSCAAVASFGPFAGGLLPLTALGVGTCTIVASDTIGGSALLTVNVATTTLVGS